MDVGYNELLNRVITLTLSRVSYFGALVYKNNPVIKNSIFCNQTANSGFILPFMANVLDSVENNINKALKASPIPILKLYKDGKYVEYGKAVSIFRKI